MKARHLIFLGLFISIISLFLLSAKEEGGDANSISMYFVVFLIPVVIIVILNGVFISFLNDQNRNRKILFSFIPVTVFSILAQLKNIEFDFLDGSISFVGLIGAIGVGLTNIIWVLSLFRDD